MSLIIVQVKAFELQSGDIILISFNCYECKVIESETNSHFSHSGIFLANDQRESMVAQALSQVRLSTLKDFLKNKTPGSKAYVYRPYEFEHRADFFILEKKMQDIFLAKYLGLPFDSEYRWDNVDPNGREMMYCSEFVAKFLDNFLSTTTIPFPLTYDKNYDYWVKYFKGNVPEGELGNSPASLSVDSRFHFVGVID